MARKKSQEKSYASLDAFAQGVAKDYDDATVVDDEGSDEVEFQTTNLVGLDNILGGGRPKGRIVEIYGPESSGKTALALHMMGICQSLGGRCILVDAEYTYSRSWCEKFRIDTENKETFQVIHPKCGEDGLEIVHKAVKNNIADIIVIDSVSALTPRAEVEGEIGDSHVGLQARMMSQALRKLTSIVSDSKCTVIFINQLRIKIGVKFGNPETTSGGNALKFYSSIRLDVRRKAWIGDKESPRGIHQRIKCIKNKVAPPFRELEIDFLFSSGYSVAKDIFKHALDFGIITQGGGGWYTTNCDYLEEQMKLKKTDMLKKIKKSGKLRKALKKEIKKCYANQETGEDEE